MGTRGLTMVIEQEKPVIAQYGQWDHYPAGQGATVLDFLRTADLKLFREKLKGLRFITQEEIDEINKKCEADKNYDWKREYPQLSRDVAAEILQLVLNGEATVLQDSTDFAKDSLFCEWAYVIDFDKNTFEVYKGFNTTPLKPEDRFYGNGETRKEGDEYYPIKLVKSYPLNELPIESQMIIDCEEREKDEDEETAEEKVSIVVQLEITDGDVKSLINYMNDGPGVVITKEHVQKVFNAAKVIPARITEDGRVDDTTQDMFREEFCRTVLGMENVRWPLYGDTEDYKTEFYNQFHKACEEKYIKVKLDVGGKK